MSLGIENPLPKLQRRRGRKRSPAVSVNAIAKLSLLTASTHSRPSEADHDGHGEHGSKIVTPRHTGTGIPVAIGKDKSSCSLDTEETRRNATGCGGQGSDRIANVIGNDLIGGRY